MGEKNYAKEYYIKNRDIILNRAKEYYINNKEQKVKKYQKEYRKKYKIVGKGWVKWSKRVILSLLVNKFY